MNKVKHIHATRKNRLTTISITHENYELLRNLGQTGDSFNDVLSKLLKNINGSTIKGGETSSS